MREYSKGKNSVDRYRISILIETESLSIDTPDDKDMECFRLSLSAIVAKAQSREVV